MRALFLTLFLPYLAHADEPSGGVEEIIQELFIGQTVYSQEQLELQLTSGLSFARSEANDTFELPLALEFGLTDRLQIELEGFGAFILAPAQQRSGIGNPSLGLLYNIVNSGEKGFALSTSVEGTLPALTDGVGEDAFSSELSLIGYQEISSLAINLQLSVEVAREQKENTLGATLSVGVFGALGHFRPTAELSASLDAEQRSLTVAPGLLYRMGELEFGVGAPIDIIGGDLAIVSLLVWEHGFAEGQKD
jgi:hypothetical protein